MPNHVTTLCTVLGRAEDIAAFKERMLREGDGDEPILFDFERILPMPDCVRHTSCSSNANLGFEILTGGLQPGTVVRAPLIEQDWVKDLGVSTLNELRAWAESNNPQAMEEGRRLIAAHEETGSYNWFDWSVAHWGTKWNSYSCRILDDGEECLQFRFDTAWTFPQPVFEALAKEYPGLVLHCACIGEGGLFSGLGEFNGAADFTFGPWSAEVHEAVFGQRPEEEPE